LANILYQRNGTVFLAGRSSDRGLEAVKTIQERFPDSDGHIEFLKVDLADLSSIKPAVESFLSRSSTLHCLTNNAGVMMTPDGSRSVQVNARHPE
jgi:retinol dehydrogenase 12